MKKLILKKPFFLGVSLFSIVAVILRFFQLKTNIFEDSGFYKSVSSPVRIIFIIFVVIAFLFGPFILWLKKKMAVLPIKYSFDVSPIFSEKPFLGFVAFGFAVNTFLELFSFSNQTTAFMTAKTITVFSVLTFIFSLLSLLYFIICTFFDNKKASSSIICTSLVIWAIFRTLRNFISFPVILPVSQNLISVFYSCLLIICLFSVCRLICTVNQKSGFKIFTLFAPITITLGFVLSVPVILGYICGFSTVNLYDAFSAFIDLVLSVFLMRFSMHLLSER